MRLVIFDLETTGLDPRHHQPIQIGAVALDGETLCELEAFEVKVRFEQARAAPEALAVNSFEESAWEKEAVSEHEAARAFSEFLKRHATTRRETAAGKPFFVAELGAFNSAFDMPFILAWYERLGEFLPAAFHGRCFLQRAMWHFFEASLAAPPDWKLGTLCDAFGVPLGEYAHDAVYDARATASLYRKMLSGAAPTRVARRAHRDRSPRHGSGFRRPRARSYRRRRGGRRTIHGR